METSRFQSKITRHTKNLEDLKLNLKRQVIDTNTKTAEMLELFDKDFRAAIIKMLQWAIMNMLEMNEEIESLSKETRHEEEPNGNFSERENK